MIVKETERKQNRVRLLMALILLALAISTVASAEDEMPDLSRTGSITLTLTDDDTGEVIPGGTIAVWQVAAAVSGDTGYEWQYTESFSDCTEALDDLESTWLIDSLVSYVETKNLDSTEISIDSQGTALYDGVSVGLYLIMQTQAAEGYEAFLPFLVTVPRKTDSGWIYDVDASPKVEPVTASETETDSTAESETEPVSESETEAVSESETEAVSEKESQPDSENETEAGNATTSEDESETETASETLPQTGRLLWPIPVLAVLGILFFVLGRFLTATNRKV